MATEEQKIKESKKKRNIIIASISAIAVIIPAVIGVMYALPQDQFTDKTTVDDFPLEMFSQGYDQLCNRDDNGYLACVIKNDGRIGVRTENGVLIFQTKDYSLLKNFGNEFGYEEKTISSAFHSQNVIVKEVDKDGLSMWLVTAKGRQ